MVPGPLQAGDISWLDSGGGPIARAIVVEILDLETGRPIAEMAQGHVTEGDYTGLLNPYWFRDGIMVARSAADERAGTYTVFVTHPDYDPWMQTDVRVRQGVCHVITQTLRAEMTPSDRDDA